MHADTDFRLTDAEALEVARWIIHPYLPRPSIVAACFRETDSPSAALAQWIVDRLAKETDHAAR